MSEARPDGKLVPATLAKTIEVKTDVRVGRMNVRTASIRHVKVDQDTKQITIVADEPREQQRGVEIVVTIPFATAAELTALLAKRLD